MFSQFDKQQLYGTQRNVTEFKLSQKNVAGFALAAINAFYIHRKVEQGQCQLNYYNHLQIYGSAWHVCLVPRRFSWE